VTKELADLTPITEAQRVFFAAVPAPELEKEECPLTAALGRVVAEPIVAQVDVPGFSRSTVDGYAVRARDTFGASAAAPAYLELIGEVAMGQAAAQRLGVGQAVRIATGGMLPEGADAVVMVEYTAETPDGQVEIRRPAAPLENVIERGEDVRRGQVVLEPGHRLRPQDIGALAGIGCLSLPVYRRPRVAIIATGDEIVPPETEPGPGEVRDINSYSLAAQVEQEGGVPVRLGIVRDEYELLHQALQQAVAENDMVLISGGSSVGTRDVAARAINSLGEPGVLIHGVTLKPGKPTILAVAQGKPVYGMPGHPVSALVVYRLFVRPVLRRLMGCSRELLPDPYVEAVLTRNVHSDPGRTEYIRVRLVAAGDELQAEPVLGASGLIMTMARADGLIVVPLGSDGLEAGSRVRVYPFPGA